VSEVSGEVLNAVDIMVNIVEELLFTSNLVHVKTEIVEHRVEYVLDWTVNWVVRRSKYESMA
jgi:hypothetical protein